MRQYKVKNNQIQVGQYKIHIEVVNLILKALKSTKNKRKNMSSLYLNYI